ncbi:MAG TPA: hypothetical protein VHM20_00345, partial [Gammaproteobacteria bacterium]|nr:hypothetical protein [Gammaproteobacteria bacterium]
MALSEHSDYKYIDIPEFIPLKSSHSLKKNIYPTFPLKTIAYHMFAIISALTHGLNSFMAGTVIVNRIEDAESKSLGELLENPLESLTPASFAVGSIFGICSFFVNYAQLLDYMPKLKNDLFSLKILTENISTNKKTAMLLSAGFSLAAATINSIFAWDTYRSISS